MSEDAGLNLDFDALEGQVLAVQRAADPELKDKLPVTVRAVTLAGKQFRLADKIGLMPVLKFAHAANSGMDTGDMRAFDAIYEMLQDVIAGEIPPCGECPACLADEDDKCPFADPGDWTAFEQHAVASKADADDLLDVVGEAITLITARPTVPPSDSSRSVRRNTRNSTGTSSGRQGAASNGSRRARRAT